MLYVCNVDDVSAASGNQYVEQVREAIKGEDAELIIISAQTEADIAELETYEEKQMFLEDLGLKESGCNRLIKAIYSLLNLETFITAGEMEVKAWTIARDGKRRNAPALSIRISRKGLSGQRSSSMRIISSMVAKQPCAKPESWVWKVRNTWYRMGTVMHFRFNV